MNFALYSVFALLLWAALFALYFILRREKLAKESLIAKCAGSFLAVTSAGLAICLQGGNPLYHPAFWFFVLCTGADALLEISFVPGMLLFGAAHLCLIVWMAGLAPLSGWVLLPWALAYLFAIWLFRKQLPTLGRQLPAFCLYPALLGASLALGLVLPFTAGPAYWVLAVGTLCFFISDMMVAKQTLCGLPDSCHKLVMLLYWGALYLISAVLWV